MKHALVVDDRSENRYMLRVLLQANGFSVDEAAHGVEALDLARSRPPDVVISDLLMPEMDGYTLLRHWKADAALRDVPFIVYTATYTDPKDEALARHLGADAFLLKPAEPDVILACVHDVMARLARGEAVVPAQGGSDPESLRLYSEVLVRKLEQRSAQLEERVAALTASEAHVQGLNRRYAVLSETNKAIVHILERDQLLQTVCRIAVEIGGLQVAWVGMADSGHNRIEPVAWHGPAAEWFSRVGGFTLRGPRRTPAEIALGEERLYLCNDLQSDPALAPIHALLLQAGLRSAAACPLRVGRDVVGVLVLLSGATGYFDEAMRELVAEMSSDVSFALENYEKEELRRQTEAELRRLNTELERRVQERTVELTEANKALEAFNYSVSHDLRAPLAAISGFGSILLQRSAGQLDAAAQGMLQRLLANTERMGRLIDDLLNLARVSRQPMHTTECDLSALAMHVLDGLRHAAPGRSVQAVVAPGLRARADPGLLRILLENLLGNAWKFTANASAAAIEMGSENSEHGVCFYVRDNGAGFDMQHASKLFEPFHRMHGADEFEGTGIGLSIVHRIVARHKGRVWMDAAPGAGATVRFTLP